ncbi:MAG: His/Gly/Thr/Pro-type tRNA ligase C-terminal domain-containing protein, partial [Planctomycetales bacterium]
GEKTAAERFPGAVSTYSIEALMQDNKALQAGTSHFLGQNFSRVQEIKFQDETGTEQFAWTTSWGVSTRLIGGLVMTHSDDDGVIVPPRLAPTHVVILPILRGDDTSTEVLDYCDRLQANLADQSYAGAPVKVSVDRRDLRGGEKTWQHIKKGVPIRVEIGPRDVQSDSCFVARRDQSPKDKRGVPREEFVQTIAQTLGEIQDNLFNSAVQRRAAATRQINNLDDFKAFFAPQKSDKSENHGGLAYCHWSEEPEVERLLKEMKVTIRCIPLDDNGEPGECIFTGKPSQGRAVFAKAY